MRYEHFPYFKEMYRKIFYFYTLNISECYCGFISQCSVHYWPLFVRGHMIYIVPRRSRGQYYVSEDKLQPIVYTTLGDKAIITQVSLSEDSHRHFACVLQAIFG